MSASHHVCFSKIQNGLLLLVLTHLGSLFIRLLSIATTKAVGYINTNMKIELDTNIKQKFTNIRFMNTTIRNNTFALGIAKQNYCTYYIILSA